jgi:hypothetical protein
MGAPDGEGAFFNQPDDDELGLSDASRSSSPEAFLNPFTQELWLPPILEEEEDDLESQARVAPKPVKRHESYRLLPLLTMLYRIYEACMMMGWVLYGGLRSLLSMKRVNSSITRSNITMFVVARTVYTMCVDQRSISAAPVDGDSMVQVALYWSEKLRNLSGILLVVTALCMWNGRLTTRNRPLLIHPLC